MEASAMFDAETWGRVPFHFWSVAFFAFGCIVGSFLNVCIHRIPRGESIVSPPSHCPHCNYSIPWYLNIPLATWLYLRGKCANCRAPISIRYFLVELLTGTLFMACWLKYGNQSAWVALVYCVFIAGLITGSAIDHEHYIVPDRITIGGTVVGLALAFLVPGLHGATSPIVSLKHAFLGILIGAGIFYVVLRGGKLFFGRQKLALEGETNIIFTETAIVLPGQEIAYEEVFYRKSDTIKMQATKVELCDRCYKNVLIRLSPSRLQIGGDEFKPDEVPYMEAMTAQLVLPREAMGLGDVKLMAAIGAFLGWRAAIFSLAVSSLIGSVVGVTLIALKKMDRSSRVPFVPYIATAAAIWIFGGKELWEWFFRER